MGWAWPWRSLSRTPFQPGFLVSEVVGVMFEVFTVRTMNSCLECHLTVALWVAEWPSFCTTDLPSTKLWCPHSTRREGFRSFFLLSCFFLLQALLQMVCDESHQILALSESRDLPSTLSKGEPYAHLAYFLGKGQGLLEVTPKKGEKVWNCSVRKRVFFFFSFLLSFLFSFFHAKVEPRAWHAPSYTVAEEILCSPCIPVSSSQKPRGAVHRDKGPFRAAQIANKNYSSHLTAKLPLPAVPSRYVLVPLCDQRKVISL